MYLFLVLVPCTPALLAPASDVQPAIRAREDGYSLMELSFGARAGTLHAAALLLIFCAGLPRP